MKVLIPLLLVLLTGICSSATQHASSQSSPETAGFITGSVRRGNKSVLLTWSTVERAVSYRIYVSSKEFADATFVHETLRTESLLDISEERGSLIFVRAVDRDDREIRQTPVLNMTASSEPDLRTDVEYSLSLLAVADTSASISISVQPSSSRASQGFIAVYSAVDYHRLGLVSLPVESFHFSRLQPNSDYTVSLSPGRSVMATSFLAFRTLDTAPAVSGFKSYPTMAPQLTVDFNFTSFTGGVNTVPLDFRVKEITNTTVSVAWMAPIAQGVQRYRVFLLTEGRIQDGPHFLPAHQLEFTYRLLKPSTTYYLIIDAVYGTNRVGAPVPLKVTTTGDEPEPIEAPDQTSLPSVSFINNTLVSISWPAVPRALFYEILGFTLHATININTSALSLITHLPSNIAFQFILTAYNSQGSSSRLAPFIEDSLFLSPTNLSVIHVTRTTATLLWIQPQGGTTITEYRCRGVRRVKKGEVVVNTAAITNMCTLSRLVAGSTYVFSVVAVSNMSTSPPVMLTIARFPSTEPVRLPPPLNLMGRFLAHDVVQLSWNAVPGALFYVLFKIENGTASTLRVGNTRVRVRVFTSASFQVAAVDRNRLEGLRSQTLRLNPVPDDQRLPAPIVTITRISCINFNISWLPVAGAVRYLLLWQNQLEEDLNHPFIRVETSLLQTAPINFTVSAISATGIEGIRSRLIILHLQPCPVSASFHGNDSLL